MRIVAVDPGTRLCGTCVFLDGKPVQAGIVRSKLETVEARAIEMATKIHVAAHTDIIIVERPVIYPGSRERDNDIVELALSAGLLAGYLISFCSLSRGGHATNVLTPTPREWKGTMPKHIHHDRLRAQCPEAIPIVERDTPKSMQNHVWDAVGLALWQLERTK